LNDSLVFTSQKREQIRGELIAAAKADSRIVGAAHLGSAALGLEDRWSDIDLALGLALNADLDQVLADWTTHLYRDYAAVANYDVGRGDILHRVFLLDNTLQVDLSFWPAGGLRAIGPKFSLMVVSRFQHPFRIQRTSLEWRGSMHCMCVRVLRALDSCRQNTC
jgi:hypothetical protein